MNRKQQIITDNNRLLRIARKMLENGLDTALIMKCTGLSAEEIAAL
ncbi:MAG: hypothetical protein GY749_16800 [Desulfobacteraceae bacterium]|nr:hypothetical protein [Desulfobacteraceae bacterium]